MLDKDDALIDEILRKILMASPGIQICLLMDKNGFTISYSAKYVTSNNIIPIERLGAIGGAVYSAVEEQGNSIEYGELDSLAVGYKNGYIFSISAGEGILSIVTDKKIKHSQIGSIMKNYRGIIADTLSKYFLKSEEVLKSDEITDELKSLLQ